MAEAPELTPAPTPDAQQGQREAQLPPSSFQGNTEGSEARAAGAVKSALEISASAERFNDPAAYKKNLERQRAWENALEHPLINPFDFDREAAARKAAEVPLAFLETARGEVPYLEPMPPRITPEYDSFIKKFITDIINKGIEGAENKMKVDVKPDGTFVINGDKTVGRIEKTADWNRKLTIVNPANGIVICECSWMFKKEFGVYSKPSILLIKDGSRYTRQENTDGTATEQYVEMDNESGKRLRDITAYYENDAIARVTYERAGIKTDAKIGDKSNPIPGYNNYAKLSIPPEVTPPEAPTIVAANMPPNG